MPVRGTSKSLIKPLYVGIFILLMDISIMEIIRRSLGMMPIFLLSIQKELLQSTAALHIAEK